MGDEDEDIHFCMKCKQVFVGLDVYVKHRKEICGSKFPTKSLEQLSKGQELPQTCSDSIQAFVNSQASVTTCNSSIGPVHTGSGESNCASSLENSQSNGVHSSEDNIDKREQQTAQKTHKSGETTSTDDGLRYSQIEHNVKSAGVKTGNLGSSIETASLLSPGFNTTTLDPNFFLDAQNTNRGISNEEHSTHEPSYQSAASVADFFSSLELKQREQTFQQESKPVSVLDEAVVDFFSSLELKQREDKREISTSNRKEQPDPIPDHAYSRTQESDHDNLQQDVCEKGSKRQLAEPKDFGTKACIDAYKSISNNETTENIVQQERQKVFEDRLQNLKFSNILNDLDFSSDEDLPSDVDELLNFSDEDEYKEDRPAGRMLRVSNMRKVRVRKKLYFQILFCLTVSRNSGYCYCSLKLCYVINHIC